MPSLPPTYVEGFHDLGKVQKMKYNDFGKTGLKVSCIGFGGAAFGNHYGGFPMEEARATIEEGIKSGINYIDTAPFYGEGKSETILGVILKDIPRQSYYIATKVARYSYETERAFDFTYDNTLKSVDQSLRLLNLDYVDVIQIHDVDFAPSFDILINETLPALQQVVNSGKARFIGITGFPLSVLKKVINASKVPLDVILSYSRLTLLDNLLLDYIADYKEKGLAIIHGAAPALGLLCNRGPWPWIPCQQEIKDVAAKAANYCKEQGVELGRLAVYWTTAQDSGIDLHLVGMQDRNILRSNLEIVTTGISAKERDVLNFLLENKLLEPGRRLTWEGLENEMYWENMKKIGRSGENILKMN